MGLGKSIVLAGLLAGTLPAAGIAADQPLDPTGSWKVMMTKNCPASLDVANSSATLSFKCTHQGVPVSVSEVFDDQRALGGGQFQFAIDKDKSSVTNYNLDTQLLLKMTGQCAATADLTGGGPPIRATASRTGPGC